MTSLVRVLVVALIISMLMLFVQVYFTTIAQKETKEYKEKLQSVEADLYPCEIELSRHQAAFKIFLKRNPKAAEEYGDIISNETE